MMEMLPMTLAAQDPDHIMALVSTAALPRETSEFP